MIDLDRCRHQISRLSADHSVASRDVTHESEALGTLTRKQESTEKARFILQSIAQRLQQQAHEQIAKTVTRCLEVVFDDPYEFRIEFEQKRGKTEARMVFIRDGLVLDDPLNEIGGGVVDVASFALRLSAILLSRPLRRRLVVLDEPFRYIRGRENRQRVRRMLVELANSLNIQFLLNVDVDAYPEFALGKVLELGEKTDASL